MQIDLDNGVPTHPYRRSLLEINLNCTTWISDVHGYICVGRRQEASCRPVGPRREAH